MKRKSVIALTLGTLGAMLFAAFRFAKHGTFQGPQELWVSTGEARAQKRLNQIAVELSLARERGHTRRIEELRFEMDAIYSAYPGLASRD
jgi:hypothetical protein